jgi:hypothetical protein
MDIEDHTQHLDDEQKQLHAERVASLPDHLTEEQKAAFSRHLAANMGRYRHQPSMPPQ